MRRTGDAAHAEIRALLRMALPELVDGQVQRWQQETGTPSWRLPPEGRIYSSLRMTHPTLPLPNGYSAWGYVTPSSDDAADLAAPSPARFDAYDYLARQVLERRDPTPAPFQPVTQRRVDDVARRLELEARERANLDLYREHADIVGKQRRCGTSQVEQLFADPRALVDLPEGLVVYHQMARRFEHGAKDRITNRAFEAHMQLLPGDVVRYEHQRSSTLKVWWFSNINRRQRWLHEHAGEEGALRLELVPRRGLYISAATAHDLDLGPMDERELILPAGSVWRVVGIRDVVFSDIRDEKRVTSERIRAVLMVELDPDAPDADQALLLSYEH